MTEEIRIISLELVKTIMKTFNFSSREEGFTIIKNKFTHNY